MIDLENFITKTTWRRFKGDPVRNPLSGNGEYYAIITFKRKRYKLFLTEESPGDDPGTSWVVYTCKELPQYEFHTIASYEGPNYVRDPRGGEWTVVHSRFIYSILEQRWLNNKAYRNVSAR